MKRHDLSCPSVPASQRHNGRPTTSRSLGNAAQVVSQVSATQAPASLPPAVVVVSTETVPLRGERGRELICVTLGLLLLTGCTTRVDFNSVKKRRISGFQQPVREACVVNPGDGTESHGPIWRAVPDEIRLGIDRCSSVHNPWRVTTSSKTKHSKVWAIGTKMGLWLGQLIIATALLKATIWRGAIRELDRQVRK